MTLNTLLHTHRPEQFELYANHLNPQLVRVLNTIGFDKHYVRAENQYLFDSTGTRYLDFLAGYGVFNMGRNHPKIKAALHEAIDSDYPNMVQMDAPLISALLAKKLLAKFPKEINTLFFCNSGTEANEGAIKFAKCATGRNKIVFVDHAFHGLTNGSLSLNGSACFREGFGALLADCVPIQMNNIEALEKELSKKEAAAFVIEVVQGKSLEMATMEFLQQARQLCDQYGTLLIVDEVQSGLGRTGAFFAFEPSGIIPDIVTVAKALSGGFIPVGAICYRRAIYNRVFSKMDRCVVHSNTFGRNHMAMAAGLAALEVVEEEQLEKNAKARGEQIIQGIHALREKYEMIKEVRGRGLMLGIEFQRPKSMKLKIGWELVHAANDSLFGQMVVVPLFTKHHILTQVAGHGTDIVKLLPPLTITEEDVRYFLSAFEAVMEECHRFPGGAWSIGKQLAMASMSNRNITNQVTHA